MSQRTKENLPENSQHEILEKFNLFSCSTTTHTNKNLCFKKMKTSYPPKNINQALMSSQRSIILNKRSRNEKNSVKFLNFELSPWPKIS